MLLLAQKCSNVLLGTAFAQTPAAGVLEVDGSDLPDVEVADSSDTLGDARGLYSLETSRITTTAHTCLWAQLYTHATARSCCLD